MPANIIIESVDWDSDGVEVVSEDYLPILILDAPADTFMGRMEDGGDELVGDIISDVTGWCHKSFQWDFADGVEESVLDGVKKIVQYIE